MSGKQRFSKIFPVEGGYNAAREREQNIVGRRIAEARQMRGLSLAGLSDLLSRHGLMIQRTGIQKWESGVALPNAYQLLAVCHALEIPEGLSWFTARPELSGEGLKKLSDYKADLIASGRYRPRPPETPDNIRCIEMPVSNLSASAGTGEFLEEGQFEMVSFPAHTVPDRADFGIRISGDSMEPVYHDGQIVWVQSCASLAPGEVGIFRYDGDGYLKVYGEQEPDESVRDSFTDSSGVLHMQPVLISYNPAYAPRPVSPELAFSIVGRVLN